MKFKDGGVCCFLFCFAEKNKEKLRKKTIDQKTETHKCIKSERNWFIFLIYLIFLQQEKCFDWRMLMIMK